MTFINSADRCRAPLITGLTVFHWTVDDGPIEPLGIIFRDMRISEETLFADGFESGDTGSWSDVAP